MIRPGEIQRIANSVGVRDQQIEKDYVLSWILFGISKHVELSEIIVFKGGTVLKKVYFQNYRFSEDIDFTLINSQISNELIIHWFNRVFEIIKSEANIPLEIFEHNQHNDGSLNFYINYSGPLGGQGNNKKIKVDISRNEKLVFDPAYQSAFIDYSDLVNYKLLCYRLEEVLVEKLRSVMQRMQARDFYDLWFLMEEYGMDINMYIKEFQKKCEHKNLKSSDFPKKLEERLLQYKGRWLNSLSDQIHELPEFDRVQREIFRHIKKTQF